MLFRTLTIILTLGCAAPSLAQLTTEQKLFDFEVMAVQFAKHYGPYEWKIRARNFDLLEIGPWLERVRRSKDDLEFIEICLDYVARLDDTDSGFGFASNFNTRLPFTTDIYDGKVLIDSIQRNLLPAEDYPFDVGDEVVAVDGKTAEEWISDLRRFIGNANERSNRRTAAGRIVNRSQSFYPRAHEVGRTASVVIRRASGDLETYDIRWLKTGLPTEKFGPAPSPLFSRFGRTPAGAETGEEPAPIRDLRAMTSFNVPRAQTEGWVLGIGSRNPIFNPPQGFIQRQGRQAADFLVSGTYVADGLRIGFIRIPNFSPAGDFFSTRAGTPAIRELETEVAYMQTNTDGLVVDVMRNPGGGCYMSEAARRLIPYPFQTAGEQHRATVSALIIMQTARDQARIAGLDSWIVDLYDSWIREIETAYKENRGLTGPQPLFCTGGSFDLQPATDEAGRMIAYAKPVMVLTDEFSISAADIFAAIMQDAGRALHFGWRTNGAGGRAGGPGVIGGGHFSESSVGVTRTIVTRKAPVVTDDHPTAPYIENIGVRPDIYYDYMTRENLMTGGRPFVEAFTSAMVEHIRRNR